MRIQDLSKQLHAKGELALNSVITNQSEVIGTEHHPSCNETPRSFVDRDGLTTDLFSRSISKGIVKADLVLLSANGCSDMVIDQNPSAETSLGNSDSRRHVGVSTLGSELNTYVAYHEV